VNRLSITYRTLLLLWGIPGLFSSVKAASGLEAVWNSIADSQPAEAQAALRQVELIDARERALAGVVVALTRLPLTGDRLRELDLVLADLTAEVDDLSARALYLRARLHQVHSTPANYARAGELYRELAQRHPASHWAQLGLVKLGLISLYALPETADPADRLAKVAALLGAITEPALRRDLQMQIGWAGLFYNRPLDEVLPHLIAAERTGGLFALVPEDLVLQIGELSLRAGQYEQARTYFDRFLREYPVSLRRYNVQQRMLELVRREKEGGS
jgi:hypothetical protein